MVDADGVRPWYRRRGPVAGLTTVAVVALVGGGIVLAGGSDPEAPVAEPTSSTNAADLVDLDDCREIEEPLPDLAPPAPIGGGGQQVRPPERNTPESPGGEQPGDDPAASGDAADSFGGTFGGGDEAAVGDALCFRGHVVAVGDAVLEAGPSGDRVVVSVIFANRSDRPQPYGEAGWSLEADDGEILAVGDEGSGRFAGELGPGETIHGLVAFDVGGGRHLVVYEPAHFEGARAVWAVEV